MQQRASEKLIAQNLLKRVSEKKQTASRLRINLRFSLLLLCLMVMLVLSITLGVMLGPVPIHPETVWKIAFSHVPLVQNWIPVDWTGAEYQIIWHIRFPRVLLACVVGAGLALVGVVIQAFMRNSMADPYILGVSSGASVVATLVILFGAMPIFGQYALSLGAFLGALVTIIAVFMLAQVNGRIQSTRLLLSGIAISMILNAATSFIVMMAPREEGIKNALHWMLGGLSGAKWAYLPIPAVVVVAAVIFLMLHYRTLNALLMGEETAVTLGIKIDQFRKILLVITSLVTGVLVAVSGAIGFIGLMIPHIARLLLGSNHRLVLPASALLGAIFLLWSDVVARTALAPEEMPVGIVTAFCGGPFLIWLLRRSSYSFGGERE